MSSEKKLFTTIFLLFTVTIMVLPLIVSLNEALTRVIEQNAFYGWIQYHIVPVEAKMMGVILTAVGYQFGYSPQNSSVVVNNLALKLTWNCLGWQSFLLLFLTLAVGLRGRYKKISILEAFLIGTLGTFWLNIIRMLFTVLLAVHVPPIFRIVYHDYLAAFTTVVWLFFFWWFAYRYVLED